MVLTRALGVLFIIDIAASLHCASTQHTIDVYACRVCEARETPQCVCVCVRLSIRYTTTTTRLSDHERKVICSVPSVWFEGFFFRVRLL